MPRYFIEISYKGANYSGSQKQQNANSIQSEIEKALKIFFKQSFILTGASRTDAGVHALQNFFHFDAGQSLEIPTSQLSGNLGGIVYRLNAILPGDISVINLLAVKETAHCRYDAIEREYQYFIYSKKSPFLSDRAYFFPYTLQVANLNYGAAIVSGKRDFTSFSKRSTQVNNFFCHLHRSYWTEEESRLIYTVSGNRFLRGMVRGLVGTMLKLGREIITPDDFEKILQARDPAQADFSAPAHGLFLNNIKYAPEIFM